MGIIMSARPQIDETRFTALKRGVIHPAESVLLLERLGDRKSGPTSAIVKLSSGQFTVLGMRHIPNDDFAMMGYGVESGNKAVLSGLVKMGAITQADMDAHVKDVTERERQKDREWAADQLRRSCATLGIPVPPIPT